MKHSDPIVEEVRRYRDQLAAEHHYNLDEVFRFVKGLEGKNKTGLIVSEKTSGRKRA